MKRDVKYYELLIIAQNKKRFVLIPSVDDFLSFKEADYLCGLPKMPAVCWPPLPN